MAAKTTKRSRKLTLKDRLSRLTWTAACQLLGPAGPKLVQAGGTYDQIDIDRDVYLGGDLFRVTVPRRSGQADAVVTITLMASARGRLHFNCTACETPCEHVGAAFSLILEEKAALGLAEPPIEEIPLEHLSDEQLIQRALAERAARAAKERFRLRSTSPSTPWTDYVVTSGASGRSYRVALRGEQRGDSYCSCPDFRTNTLGTCKHIMYALRRVRARFSEPKRRRRPKRTECSVYVKYSDGVALWMAAADKLDPRAERIIRPLLGASIDDVHDLLRRVRRLEQAGCPLTIYPDAEELIRQRLLQGRLASVAAAIRRDPAGHPLRSTLLKTELLPYQLDGIAFATAAGRAILADEMGLGKTIQGIGMAELLAREAGIRTVLVVCPASLKSQWRSEIQRFTSREVQLITGGAARRAAQYRDAGFFTICNYEQVLRDTEAIERAAWDLIILDEGQRIKNWASKTSGVVKRLKSCFALVLSGTPLENRLDDLYSVVEFIDDRRLGPAFRFFNRHRVVDENGRVIGYRNLDRLRANLQPILLRRTRESVLQQLPPRTTEIVRIEPAGEQVELHDGYAKVAAMIARKPYITEMDLLRLQKALLMCRLAANSTFLVDKEAPGYSSKLAYLQGLLEHLFREKSRKAVLFSEWTTMLDLIEPMLQRCGLAYVRLDGSVPQLKRQQLVRRFHDEGRCRLFITTNAGSTGLNLQAADTVINVDLPWNPAVLEQRISRAHRMGQERPVQVFVLITESTIEENLLKTLSLKHDLFMAALDAASDVTEVDFISNIEELKRRLEVLLGAQPAAPVDESSKERAGRVVQELGERRQRVAAAGGELLGAVFSFLGELLPGEAVAPPPQAVEALRDNLVQCVDEDEQGRPRLTVTLPDRGALDNLVESLARFISNGGPGAKGGRAAEGEQDVSRRAASAAPGT